MGAGRSRTCNKRDDTATGGDMKGVHLEHPIVGKCDVGMSTTSSHREYLHFDSGSVTRAFDIALVGFDVGPREEAVSCVEQRLRRWPAQCARFLTVADACRLAQVSFGHHLVVTLPNGKSK
mmetsp:Transcript_53785/g.136504  ORF Transcript_53785/g.136504 Transcript_53785/m.136504 type:complete len:121 (-) Transcript_53785:337-699(-)